MSRDDFTKDRLAWLEQVAEDPKLPAAAKSIAIKLCTKYLSRRYGAAWPGVESLALDIRTTARTVQLAMRALVECGHLSEQRGGGKHRTNVYRLASYTAANGEKDYTVSSPNTVKSTSPYDALFRAKGCNAAHERVKSSAPNGEMQRSDTVKGISPEPFEGTL